MSHAQHQFDMQPTLPGKALPFWIKLGCWSIKPVRAPAGKQVNKTFTVCVSPEYPEDGLSYYTSIKLNHLFLPSYLICPLSPFFCYIITVC